MASPKQHLTIYLMPGPLNIGIKMNSADDCVVSRKEPQSNSPLQVGDILLSLNGITLRDVEGGTEAWGKLFSAFNTGERKVKVQRNATGNDSVNSQFIKSEKKQQSSESSEDSMQDDTTASKKQKAYRRSNVVSLLEDTDDEEVKVKVEQKKSSHNVGALQYSRTSMSSLDDDIEIMEVSPVSTAATSSASSSNGSRRGNLKDDRNYADTNNTNNNLGDINGDEELVVVASRGQNALADFPHSRENCVTHPFSGDKKKFCGNCYCYVCDSPAKDCKVWGSHCKATHNDPHWKRERERAKQARACAASALSVAATSRTVTAPRPAVVSRSPSSSSSGRSARRKRKSPHGRRSAEFSVRKLLQEVTSVHPVEIQPPVGSGFVTPLRHYQKQSLAFMADTEKNYLRGGWLADEVGMGKSAIVLALTASNPASPNSLATKVQINNVMNMYEANEAKKQQIQEAHDAAVAKLKTKCRESTDKLDYFHPKRQDAYKEMDAAVQIENQKMKEEINQIPPIEDRVKLKATVILTSVSLIGQWEDEAKKHSPGLVVKTFHNSRSKNVNLVTENDADVIISTSTFKWPAVITNCLEFHRVIHDESHLLIGSPSAKLDYANLIASPLRWGVTATPATNSYMDLIPQLTFINGNVGSSTLQIRNIENVHINPDESSFNNLVTWLKTYYMIRHTKSQRINGLEALALPPSTTSTVMLEMSKFEDEAFNRINPVTSRSIVRHCSSGVKDFTAEASFNFQMSQILNDNKHKDAIEIDQSGRKAQRLFKPECLTKVVALRKDLNELRKMDPALRVVVFTQYVNMHDTSVRGLKQDGFEVLQFTGSSSSRERDDAIRRFQDTSNGKAAVFVITLRSGNVGITLTAASRVYLLEPSLDPAVEVQAAGRIHRLGQNKPCHVIKFAFKNSYEANVIELHKKILAGEIAIVDRFIPSEAMKILAKGLRGVTLTTATPNKSKKRRSANRPARDILDMRKKRSRFFSSSQPPAGQPPNPKQLEPGQAAARARLPQQSNGGWQSDKDVPERRMMIAKIVQLLRQRKPNAPQEWLNKLPQVAKRLEESLYRSSPSFEVYKDISTLKARLQQLAMNIGMKTKRIQQQQQQQQQQQAAEPTRLCSACNVKKSSKHFTENQRGKSAATVKCRDCLYPIVKPGSSIR